MEHMAVYREAFIEELVDQLERMDQDLLALERQPSKELVQSIFRAAHTIKGSSATMGFEEMKRLTHEIEHLLDLVRSGRLEVTTALINLLFEALDFLKRLRDDYLRGGPFADSAEMLALLRNFSSGSPEKGPQPMTLAPTAVQRLQMEQLAASGLPLLGVQLRLSDDCQMKTIRLHLIVQELEAEHGAIAASDPPLPLPMAGEAEEIGGIALVLAARTEAEALGRHLRSMLDVASVQIADYAIPPEAEAPRATPSPEPKPPSGDERDKHKQSAQTIRVNVERLDHLMNLVGELLIDQTSLIQLKQTIARRFAGEEFAERLTGVADHMGRIVGELQESVMKARMLSIEHLFNRFPRMVRDLAQKLDKDIELVMDGMETELDRTLIEEIGDPLIHLLRNAIDHGIEPTAKRLQAGKPPKGRIRLNAYHEDNQVIITIEDDGAGISPEHIKASAVRKGLITSDEASLLSDREAIHLIFEPGFSTAASVSEVSGRGVGMDIVRNQIERLNGIVDIRTEPGRGTCFAVRLPLTLAIITGLMTKVSRRDYVIPMNNVLEIVRMPREEIKLLQGEQIILIRQEVIPLVWLQDVLGYPQSPSTGKFIPVVIVGSAEKKLALAVDELLGNQDIVIKTLSAYLGKTDFISGATILGNGRVALILEMSSLVKAMRAK